ncbi:MAG TPA: HAMP domain-containing sensor histidine kinase [Dictyobacter sp.]|nr:HAMP domain-containing sensor histidine kinase [Dictyobacter sp.]
MEKAHVSTELSSGFATGRQEFVNAEWLATLSHELRSPLAAIHGYATLLQRYDSHLSGEERQEFLQSIAEGSERLVALLNQLFDVAQFEAGLVKLHFSSFDLLQCVQEIFQQLEQETSLPQPGTRFVLQLEKESMPEETGLFIDADRLRLRQVLVQLLENAQKFSPYDTPIEVTISLVDFQQDQVVSNLPAPICTQLAEQGQPFVFLRIHDYGIGIPKEQHERIFERFQKANVQLTREENGLGIGLTLSRAIMSLHHGWIWAESEPGTGSTFHVLIPLHYRQAKDSKEYGCEENNDSNC